MITTMLEDPVFYVTILPVTIVLFIWSYKEDKKQAEAEHEENKTIEK